MKRLIWITVLGAGLYAGLAIAQEPATKSESTEHSESSEDKLAVWKWANFVILVAGLGYLVAKSVPAMFKSRGEEILKGIQEAQKVKQDAEKRAAEMEARLAKLGADIEAFRIHAKADMEKEGQRILDETAAHAKKLEAQAAAEIESAGKAARASLKRYAADLALDLAAQRIQSRLDANAEDGLVDNFLSDLKHQGSKN
jgi:F0F1-type ATP synthase membrane subunit b/b'